MATATQINILPEQERQICIYAQKAHELLMNQFSLRNNLENIDRYYAREDDWTEEQVRARIANKVGDKKKLQNVTVPIVYPQVRAALGYLGNVFLTGYPLFGVSSDPATAPQALQMETIVAENAISSRWTRQLLMFFIDGLKYNLHGLELEWGQKTVYDIETNINSPNNARPKSRTWQGNVLKRMDLYNTFFDPRVHPAEIHEYGEYAGYIEMYSRIRLKQLCNDLFGKVAPATIIKALESGPSPGGMTGSGQPFSYYIPIINPYPIMNRQNILTFDWMAWAEAANARTKDGIKYQNVFEVMKLYARILPADFGFDVPEKNTPQVWKFIIINGQVVLFAERQANAHNFIPMFFGQPLEDGLDFQTKSFASNVTDMQDVASAMWNGYLASKRRLVGDRVIYDPLRINAKDINSDNPAAKIPVRPSAYGRNVSEAVYQFPFHDEQTASLLEGSDLVVRFSNVINQQNPAAQGQFVKGNKTLHEYEDVMGHGNSNNQLMAISTEDQVFTPMKEAIKLNILQFQGEAVMFNRDKQQQVNIKPEELRKAAIHFKVSDGITPKEKQLSTDEFQTALQVIGSSPQVGSGFDMASLISYLFMEQGADLRPFQKSSLQMQYEQQVQSWQSVMMEALKAKELPTKDQIDALTKLLQTQPPMPPALQQELQQKQQGGGAPSPTSDAAEATQT